MKILIAEDDMTTLLILEGCFKKWGFDTLSARDGNAALSILEKEDSPKIALLDWMMPGMDGIEVCRRIKQRTVQHVQAYIIMVTARNSKDDIVKGFDAGADDYITKPFDQNELQARIFVAKRLVNTQMLLAQKVAELKEALLHVKTLQGIIPICMYCHKIRNDADAWDRLETYMTKYSNAEFSHGICPDCARERFPELDIGDVD
ncbi:MAG: response regulator transcription factor [Desulfobacter sp.]|nr:MAG: response regulator transcription factor [Desulfobacter sp.]